MVCHRNKIRGMNFFKKKNQVAPPEANLSEVQVSMMPEAFYGGKDPVVYSSGVLSSAKKNRPPVETLTPPVSASIGTSPTSAASSDPTLPVAWWKKRRTPYIIGGGIFLLAAAGISWYYLASANPTSVVTQPTSEFPTDVLPPPVPAEVVVPVTIPEVVPAPDGMPSSSPIASSLSTTSSFGQLQFPPTSLVGTADLDTDGLTDTEEEVFGTDSGTRDTDKDGYYDGQEVMNLYNPKGLAPVKLIDSGLVLEYVNPTWRYRVYYPTAWTTGNVDPAANQVLFSTITGDYVELRVFEKLFSESFPDWFAVTARGEQFTDMAPFVNRFTQDGWKRQDGLVFYFPTDTKVFVFIYHPASSAISYGHILRMMAESFRPEKTTMDIPSQPVLPQPTPFDSEVKIAPETVGSSTERMMGSSTSFSATGTSVS